MGLSLQPRAATSGANPMLSSPSVSMLTRHGRQRCALLTRAAVAVRSSRKSYGARDSSSMSSPQRSTGSTQSVSSMTRRSRATSQPARRECERGQRWWPSYVVVVSIGPSQSVLSASCQNLRALRSRSSLVTGARCGHCPTTSRCAAPRACWLGAGSRRVAPQYCWTNCAGTLAEWEADVAGVPGADVRDGQLTYGEVGVRLDGDGPTT